LQAPLILLVFEKRDGSFDLNKKVFSKALGANEPENLGLFANAS
jgi:hypothetical protein